jgi:hypothetical protein
MVYGTWAAALMQPLRSRPEDLTMIRFALMLATLIAFSTVAHAQQQLRLDPQLVAQIDDLEARGTTKKIVGGVFMAVGTIGAVASFVAGVALHE